MALDNEAILLTAKKMREDIVEMCHRLGSNAAHLGGCMSLVELLAVLYKEHLRLSEGDPQSEYRDRVVMSKGQGSIAMYAAMHQCGLIPDLKDVGALVGEGNIYYKQCIRAPEYGLEFYSGSLGQGLAYAVGIALALRIKQNDNSRVYVFLGDGECDEGSVWEAASLAGHMGLDNIIVIVDRNGLQIDGYTRDINNMDKLEDRWKAFGFEVDVIDGHNVEAIHAALSSERHGCPRAIVADTVKGKGVSFAENEVEWHQNVLTDELYARALKDVREGIS